MSPVSASSSSIFDLSQVRNRIIGHVELLPSEILDHPGQAWDHPTAQANALVGILEEVGIVDEILIYKSERAGGKYVTPDGHLRKSLDPQKPWPCTILDLSDEEADYVLATKDPVGMMKQTNAAALDALLSSVSSSNQAVQEMLADVAAQAGLYLEPRKARGATRHLRILALDIIYTLQGADATCCIAVQAGFKYGIQSHNYRLCPYTHELSGRHEVAFVDNEYSLYDHARHLAVVKEFKPKYATVRDIMNPAQCARAKIAYFEFEQILDWAEELRAYAQNVIMIPKYDCLDRIPEHFMLGYSIPTSHGGTPLPVSAFSGRRVHLLGGSWKAQIEHLELLGDDVVSLDNNYIASVATQYAAACDPEGEAFAIPTWVTNPRYVALAITCGAIGCKVNQLMTPQASDDTDEPDSAEDIS